MRAPADDAGASAPTLSLHPMHSDDEDAAPGASSHPVLATTSVVGPAAKQPHEPPPPQVPMADIVAGPAAPASDPVDPRPSPQRPAPAPSVGHVRPIAPQTLPPAAAAADDAAAQGGTARNGSGATAAAAAAPAAPRAAEDAHAPAPIVGSLPRNSSAERAVRSISADELDSSVRIGAATAGGDGARIGGQASGRIGGGPGGGGPDGVGGDGVPLGSARFDGVGNDVDGDGGRPEKPRGGLFNRLRKALRGNAQAARARKAQAASARAANRANGDSRQQPAGKSRAFTFSSRNLGAHSRSNGTGVRGVDEMGEARDAPAAGGQPWKGGSTKSSRRFLGRGGGDKNNRASSELDASGLSAAGAQVQVPPSDDQPDVQSVEGIEEGDTSSGTAAPDGRTEPMLSASQPLSGAAFDGTGAWQEPATGASASTGNIARSLPKSRVFSSPPSFSFGFGSRRRTSMANKQAGGGGGNGKGGGGKGASANGSLDGESGVDKANRTYPGRGYDLGRGSGHLNLMTVSKPGEGNVAAAPDRNAAAFRTKLNTVIGGNAPFVRLLDAMFLLEERLPPETKDTLVKYLSKPDHITALIESLTVVVPVVAEDEGVQGPGGERARYRYSYVSSMLLSNGPIQLRRSLFLSPKHLDRLVGVLGHGTPTDAVVVRSVCKVLLSVLRDSPEDTVRAMVRRSDFLDALLSHISVTGCPEVCLSMLSTVRCQAELKFGPPNKPIVGVMADANLLHTLCDKLAVAARTTPVDGAASSAIENCSRVIVGIALRALVIPRFEINDDESDAEYMSKFNRDLASLDVFHQPDPILRLLDSGFEALDSHDSRGYALSTALTAVRYLMVTAINGQDSSLSTIRMQLLSVNTSAYEAGIRARIPALANVLKTARRDAHVETMWSRVEAPLGVVRLKVLELLVVLLQHGNHETAQSLVDAGVPRALMDLFARLELNSLLQHFVATIVEHSFRMTSPALRKAFFLDVNLIDMIMYLWRESEEREKTRKSTPVNNLGEMSRISVAMRDFLSNASSPEVKQMSAWLGKERVGKFTSFCEGSVAEHDALNGQLLGGVDELPNRIDDDSGFGENIFFRPRTGSTAVET